MKNNKSIFSFSVQRIIFLALITMLLMTLTIGLTSCSELKGEDGKDGLTPTIEISQDGYWVINGEKTNVKAEGKDGKDGKDGIDGKDGGGNPQGLDFFLKDDGTYSVAVGKAKYMSKIEIPATYNGRAVTEIAYLGFSAYDNMEELPLKEIIIPDSVTAIGYGAFAGCTSLTSVVIPEGVTNLEDTFNGCTSLTSVNIPDSVTNLKSTFYGCTSLTSVVIPEGVTNLEYTFYGCTSLASVVIPKGVTNLKYTFYGCTSLTSVVIPEGVTNLVYTFFGCTSLTSIYIPRSVTEIDYFTFNNCSAIQDVYYAGSSSEWYSNLGDPYYDVFRNASESVKMHYNYVP